MSLRFLTVVLAFLGVGAGDAFSQIRPPQSGFVWDTSLQAIRPVLGLPGAWTLGPALDLGMPILGARFAVDKNFALIISDGNPTRLAVVTGLSSGTIAVVPVDKAFTADLVALNDTSSAALLYSRSERSVQWLTGLPNNPTVTRTISLSDLAGDVTALAMNRAGDLSLIGLGDGTTGSLFKVPVDGDLGFIGNVRAASIMFAENDRDAYVTDSSAGSLVFAKDGQGLSLLADSSSGLTQPGALQIVGGSTLLIASPTASSITCFDIAHGIASQTSLAVPALQIDRFGTDGLLLLNQPGTGPIYVLDASSVKDGSCSPLVLFIPPDQGIADQSAAQ